VKTFLVQKSDSSIDNQHLFIQSDGSVICRTDNGYIFAGAYTCSWNANVREVKGFLCVPFKEYRAIVPRSDTGDSGLTITLPIPSTEDVVSINFTGILPH
jgi:hypothetical protein